MGQLQKLAKRKNKKYARITSETRLELIEKVLEGHKSLSASAAKLSIKLSTAKLIVSRYRKTGTIFESQKQRQGRQLQENKKVGEVGNIEQAESNECKEVKQFYRPELTPNSELPQDPTGYLQATRSSAPEKNNYPPQLAYYWVWSPMLFLG